ncbi:DUF3068 domain-containing protein [Amycolatopsis sp. H20-H5]|uniref:DUF3068 domain-containing protein n=1 Tax=Amycolatopsis sp. H20-H5 TaxID=3046309 RepID=UPI002DB58725|nr:DUF3068 domain-containing protein [Amycolatopsis sp. H20-H5]MEC3980077.1 DUF3068 domain-containing protein [Amycolatopsis sp. H20-H5]
MRRLLGHPRTGFVVLGLGVLWLAFVPLLRWYVVPRVELTPIAVNTTTVSSGPGTYFDSTTLTTKGPVTMTATSHVISDSAEGEETGYAVWNISTTVDTPETLRRHDPRASLGWTLQRWVGDRRTDLPVHCCGESPVFTGNVYLKFPFGVTKGSYDYWNSAAGKAFPIHFTGIETIEGHQFYRFDGTVPPTRIGTRQIPGRLLGEPNVPGLVTAQQYYSDADTEILVDPMSGIPVGGTQHPLTTFRLPGSTTDRLTVLSATFTTQPASERALLAQIDSTDRQLRLIQDVLPVNALRLGGTQLLLGVALLVRTARRARKDPS